MTNKQEDFLSMSQVVITLLYENDNIWNSNVPLTETINGVNDLNEQIIDLQAQQLINNAGIAIEKKKCRNSMQESILGISGILSFYAAAISNTDLKEQMDINERMLRRATGLQLIGIANTVSDAGTNNLPGASVYGLTEEMLNNLSVSQNSFIKLLNAPRNARSAKAKATATLASLLATLRTEIKEKLDKAMVLYKNTGLYNGYKTARTIINSPTHHLALMAGVMDDGDKPIAGARITIINGKEKLRRKTSPLGNIRVQHLHEGEHTMMIEKENCETQQLSFIIAPPATTKLQVRMKAQG